MDQRYIGNRARWHNSLEIDVEVQSLSDGVGIAGIVVHIQAAVELLLQESIAVTLRIGHRTLLYEIVVSSRLGIGYILLTLGATSTM